MFLLNLLTKVINLLKNNKNCMNNNLFFKDWIFLNAKRVTLLKYNPFTLLFAPLIDRSLNYNAMIEYVTIRKLKGGQ